MPLPVHLPPLADSKSLTPQRKHRKLLKDGSGAEVWPESIEKIFVQGSYTSDDLFRRSTSYPPLKVFVNTGIPPMLHIPSLAAGVDGGTSSSSTTSRSTTSPAQRSKSQATYRCSVICGRANQASVPLRFRLPLEFMITSLEYQLVAGGEELADISPPAGSNIKLEDSHWPTSLIPMDHDDADGYSSNSSPDFSPPDFPHQYLPSPDQPASRQLDMSSSAQYTSGTSPYVSNFPSTSQDYPAIFDKYGQLSPVRTGLPMDSTSGYKYPNRVHALRLTAHGMSPFIIRTDALIPANLPYEPLQLKVRLSISTMEDVNCPPALHGFLASICLSHIWSSSAKCITKTLAGSNTVSEDVGALEVSDIMVGTVNAVLPESHLNRCRWLDPHNHTSITQEIIIDDVSLLFIVYELDRSASNPMPSAQFTGFLKYPSSRAGHGLGSSGGMTTSSASRAFSVSSSHGSGNISNRAFSASPVNSSALAPCGLAAITGASYSQHHHSGSLSPHSSAVTMGGSSTNGVVNPSGLSGYSLPMHSHHSRHPSQSLAHALTPVRYPMATSLPS
ncbi:hypothetical protein NP233_g12852 [Leucocoprinus birnbaumii]|uniref:Uncharacterized protein n=1 Tax=Leucocoprinus birnbaumii TaxID=56174 RepID=A0AAD5YMN9_9AGAR|nr:hypothetical protein NP233_g12852 [Leucocoprinus birnbaumii]